MKKIIFCAAAFLMSGKLMAQKAAIVPFDNKFENKVQPFKTDSTWRVNPPVLTPDKFLNQDLSSKLQSPLALNTKSYQMPVVKTAGNSKMPVVKLQGYSKMPVVGKGNDTNEVVVVNP